MNGNSVDRGAALPGVGVVAPPPADEGPSNHDSGLSNPSSPVRNSSSRLERWLVGRLLAACGSPPISVRLWDNAVLALCSGSTAGTVVIRDRKTLWQLLMHPSIGFGDGYSSGGIDIEGSLVDVLTAVNRAVLGITKSRVFGWFVGRSRRRSHTIAASRDSVHYHYDIGNDFYRLWLDERMQYTCAYYSAPHMTLEQAQLAKLEHVCRKLRLQPGERVFEAGCGWGGLALHMARHYGVNVRAFNLSHEQIAYAQDLAKSQGLASRVEFVEDDYRNVSGVYDAFVSVGMLEHVGLENYGELGRTIDRALTPGGRGLIHSIGRNRPLPLDPWTDKRIFPGAYPPALSEMLAIFEPFRFSVLDVENLRLHYARTLEDWLDRFNGAADKVARMFDDRFVRMWRMYLAASIATFQTGGLQLFQVVFSRESSNDISWTREHLYRAAE